VFAGDGPLPRLARHEDPPERTRRGVPMIDERELRDMLGRRAGTISATPTDAPKAIRRARQRLARNAAVCTLVGPAVLAGALAGGRSKRHQPRQTPPCQPRRPRAWAPSHTRWTETDYARGRYVAPGKLTVGEWLLGEWLESRQNADNLPQHARHRPHRRRELDRAAYRRHLVAATLGARPRPALQGAPGEWRTRRTAAQRKERQERPHDAT
jgi:hypothetical protein